jgi:hypothetical protein
MDSSAVWKRANTRNINALTATSANGVLICDAAAALIRVDTTESRKKPVIGGNSSHDAMRPCYAASIAPADGPSSPCFIPCQVAGRFRPINWQGMKKVLFFTYFMIK